VRSDLRIAEERFLAKPELEPEHELELEPRRELDQAIPKWTNSARDTLGKRFFLCHT